MKRTRTKLVKEFIGWYKKGLKLLKDEEDKSMSFRYGGSYYIWLIPGKEECHIALQYELTRNVKEYELSRVPLTILKTSIRFLQEIIYEKTKDKVD